MAVYFTHKAGKKTRSKGRENTLICKVSIVVYPVFLVLRCAAEFCQKNGESVVLPQVLLVETPGRDRDRGRDCNSYWGCESEDTAMDHLMLAPTFSFLEAEADR